MARLRTSALRVTTGWEQATVSQIVTDTLEQVIEPIVFSEALDEIRMHQAAGRKVFIVSASPEEIVAPLARYLGVDEAIATRARLDDEGRYTGEVEFYSYGPGKVVAMEHAARRDGFDLAQCWAYSDSVTDLPMLEAVGHPVVVNPDRDLAKAAARHDWEVRTFDRPIRLRDRAPDPTPAVIGLAVGVDRGDQRRGRRRPRAAAPTHLELRPADRAAGSILQVRRCGPSSQQRHRGRSGR